MNHLLNKIHNADCLEFMKQLPDKCVDLVLTSPPYNTGGKSMGHHPNSEIGNNFYSEYDDNKTDTEYREFIFARIKESIRISRYSFWNIQMLSGNKEIVCELFYEFKNNIKDMTIWQKQAVSQIQKGRLAKGFEFIFMFGEDNNMSFDYRNFPENNYVPNIFTWYPDHKCKHHHAVFPFKMARHFIERFTNNSDIIFDPFMGSGTTAIASYQLGRKWFGAEISEEYCQISRKRVSEEMDNLFEVSQ